MLGNLVIRLPKYFRVEQHSFGKKHQKIIPINEKITTKQFMLAS